MPNLVKKLGNSKYYNSGSPRPVESPGKSIRYNCQRSAANQEDLKPYWESEKRTHFSRWSTIPL